MTSPRKPNVLFVMADQWRAHAIGCAGQDPVITPHMDAFAAESTRLENACTVSPICTPSRASIIGGKHPFSLNMMSNWLQFPVDEPTIPKTFQQNGYRTGFIGKWHLDAFLEGDQENCWNIFTPPGERRLGFDFWYAHGCNHNHFSLKYMDTAGEIHRGEGWQVDHETDVAVDYLKTAAETPDEPFCLFLSWSPPHTEHGPERQIPGYGAQYHAPEQYEALYRREDLPVRPNADPELFRFWAPGYFGAVTSMDDNFARLLQALEELDLAEDTIVVLTADHGEMLASHGRFTKDVWYEESIGIPFLIRWPGKIPAGRVEPFLFSTIDFYPTLAGLAGLNCPGGLHGRDLSAVFQGREDAPDAPVFLAHNAGSPYGVLEDNLEYPPEPGRKWRGVRTRRYTYVAFDNTEQSQYHDAERFTPVIPSGIRELLYDNQNDPYQKSPIAAGQGADDVLSTLRTQVSRWLEDLGDDFMQREFCGRTAD